MRDIPESMQAMAITPLSKQHGILEAATCPVPTINDHEILLRIQYAGVNRADIMQRNGLYPPPANASPLPGLEASGEIVAIGKNVTHLRVGDLVCALLAGGGYGQFATVQAAHCLPIPQGWTMEEAAALPEAAFTIWMSLGAEAKLQSGETFLVHGGASGIGMTAIQYANALGAVVYATASSPEKCAMCKSWGATHAIQYTTTDFVDAIDTATAGKGVNVILDFIGGEYIPRNFQCLATNGRMISLAFLGGANVDSLSLIPILRKRLLWKGTTLRAQSDAVKSEYAEAIRTKMWPFIAAGKVRPHIDKVFSLSEAQKAHDYMEQNLNIGKIVLQV